MNNATAQRIRLGAVLGSAVIWMAFAMDRASALDSALLSPPEPLPSESSLRLEEAASPAGFTNDGGLSLVALEAMALENNPTLTQAAAQLSAARGVALQAGLYPNPVIGYIGDQIGTEGSAGELQGGFFSQEFVTAGKLRLSRAKYLQTVTEAEFRAVAQRYRVLNGVRTRFYQALAADRAVELHRRLLDNARDVVRTTKEMGNLGQANQVDRLQASVQASRARVDLKNAEASYRLAWENLVTVVGVPELPVATLDGALESAGAEIDWDSALERLLAESPELQVAHTEVRRDRIQLRRERAQPIPNVTVEVSTGHNYENGDTVAGVTIGIPLPTFNRNQGTIRQARSEVTRSCAAVRRVELDLRRRLAVAFRHYRTAKTTVDEFAGSILPQARKAYELNQEAYKQRRGVWMEVLMTQRMVHTLGIEYIDQLRELREAEVAIDGLLLVGGLVEPPAPTPGGHIDATPNPR